jgi:2-succinyl-5-enolpyruvyl-6-hydroxy-3-cyclohexene-1-carboxylate synthase
MAQLFHLDPSIEVHCNRGTDGIDGCMSTAVGFASATEKTVFLMIGDLTFFYDMNSLWNRHLGNNLRIFLENNGGGSIMHLPKRPEFAAKLLPNYISAKHDASAKAWAIDRGITYLSARNEKELRENMLLFTSSDTEGPVLFEVFNDLLDDVNRFKQYHATVNRSKLDQSLKSRSKRVILDVFNILGIDPATIKNVIIGKKG